MKPSAIANSRGRQQLRLDWPDGREQLLDHVELRRQCPCSQCRALRLRGLVAQVDSRVCVIEVNAQGYGLQLVFSDGHERGIYPWRYLSSLTSSVVDLNSFGPTPPL